MDGKRFPKGRNNRNRQNRSTSSGNPSDDSESRSTSQQPDGRRRDPRSDSPYTDVLHPENSGAFGGLTQGETSGQISLVGSLLQDSLVDSSELPVRARGSLLRDSLTSAWSQSPVSVMGNHRNLENGDQSPRRPGSGSIPLIDLTDVRSRSPISVIGNHSRNLGNGDQSPRRRRVYRLPRLSAHDSCHTSSRPGTSYDPASENSVCMRTQSIISAVVDTCMKDTSDEASVTSSNEGRNSSPQEYPEEFEHPENQDTPDCANERTNQTSLYRSSNPHENQINPENYDLLERNLGQLEIDFIQSGHIQLPFEPSTKSEFQTSEHQQSNPRVVVEFIEVENTHIKSSSQAHLSSECSNDPELQSVEHQQLESQDQLLHDNQCSQSGKFPSSYKKDPQSPARCKRLCQEDPFLKPETFRSSP